jgi:hypothetical protein
MPLHLSNIFDSYNESSELTIKLTRISKILTQKKKDLLVMQEYIHQNDDIGDVKLKRQYKAAEAGYNNAVKRDQTNTEKIEKVIQQQQNKYEVAIENKRNDIEMYKRKKEQEIENIRNDIEIYKRKKEQEISELEAACELVVNKHETNLVLADKSSTSEYYWDKMQQLSAHMNGTARKTLSHIRLEKEVQSLQGEYDSCKNRINELNGIVNSSSITPTNTLVRITPNIHSTLDHSPPHSVASRSTIDTAEIEETQREISELERLRDEARAKDLEERLAIEKQKQDKIVAIQEHNATIRIKIKEIQAREDKLPLYSKERDLLRKERQRAENELM